AGGGSIDDSGGLRTSLEQYLQERAVPAVQVRVVDHVPQAAPLTIQIRIRYGQYQPEQVVEATRNALLGAFSLERRGIGRSLYHAEIYRVIEAVPGVEDSEIRAAPGQDRAAQRIVPLSPRHAVFVHRGKLVIDHPRGYTP
ncbi:MAG: hypothetical protein MJE77_24590, partial [Proteobacteria bacterium]|nr:hypothetical protein [Pseudomonadota bacterium]